MKTYDYKEDQFAVAERAIEDFNSIDTDDYNHYTKNAMVMALKMIEDIQYSTEDKLKILLSVYDAGGFYGADEQF